MSNKNLFKYFVGGLIGGMVVALLATGCGGKSQKLVPTNMTQELLSRADLDKLFTDTTSELMIPVRFIDKLLYTEEEQNLILNEVDFLVNDFYACAHGIEPPSSLLSQLVIVLNDGSFKWQDSEGNISKSYCGIQLTFSGDIVIVIGVQCNGFLDGLPHELSHIGIDNLLTLGANHENSEFFEGCI